MTETRVERLISDLKNNPVLAWACVAGIVIIASASLVTAIRVFIPNLFRTRFHVTVTLYSEIRSSDTEGLFFVRDTTKQIYPVGLAIDVDVTNNRATRTQIQAHVLDIKIGHSWRRLDTFTLADPHSLCFVTQEPGLGKAKCLDFTQNGLDILVANTQFEP